MPSHKPVVHKVGLTRKKDCLRRRGFAGSALPRCLAALACPAKVLGPALFLTSTWSSYRWSARLLRPIFRVLLPSSEHRNKVVPAVQHHHDQMAEHESQQRPHHYKMP